ncbi:carbohydrate kinase family protein [Aliiroseovarius sp. PTFE2010]|uniref:carbohydrate kinase family protein n=1 Tax=Aliiroseovarius sp. PTFE2010 TaxID=3417190 RepID=UPI003CFB70C1
MILNCGEALIDMLARVTGAGENAFAPYAGGAVFNTAIALGRLGAPTGFFSGLSTDLFGDTLVQVLEQSMVDTSLCLRADRPCTLAFVHLENGQARYMFYDENTAGRMITPDDLPAIPDAVEAMFFGGISLIQDPCASAYEALITRESAARVTMIDPNIRPGFIANEAAYRARIDRMMAQADIVKLSDEDLMWLEGDGDIAAKAQGLLAKGPRVVCITEGAEGARGFSRRGEVAVPAKKVAVVDTVGAGDTFNAGVLAALKQAGALTKSAITDLPEDTLHAALSLGVQTAAITVSRAGANPPWAHEL